MSYIYCNHCGSQIPADSVYCPQCGASPSIGQNSNNVANHPRINAPEYSYVSNPQGVNQQYQYSQIPNQQYQCGQAPFQQQYPYGQMPNSNPNGQYYGYQQPQSQPIPIIINNSNSNVVSMGNMKNKWVAFFLCLFLGPLGAHKFYEGRIFAGILYLLSGGIFLLGWIIDCIIILCKPNPYSV